MRPEEAKALSKMIHEKMSHENLRKMIDKSEEAHPSLDGKIKVIHATAMKPRPSAT